MSNLFNKLIEGRQFNFQPIEFGSKSGYHVDVKDEEGTRWEFTMLNEGVKEFKMEAEKLPDWIMALEQELIVAISEHE